MKALRRALAISGALLSGGCGPGIVRTEGDPIALDPPREVRDSVVFTGAARASEVEEAVAAAEADARRQAAESVSVTIASDVRRRIQLAGLDGVVRIDDRAEADIRSFSLGALEGSRREGKPYLEHFSDGSVEARVRIAVPKASLDPAAVFYATTFRQAIGELVEGRLENARGAFFALSQLRPADPLPFLYLARTEERRGERAAALDLYAKCRDLNRGEPWLAVPGGVGGREERVDLAAEIDRLTPRWENLLADFARLEEGRRDPAAFRIEAPRRASRSRDRAVRFSVFSREPRWAALLWIDDDGVFFRPPPEGPRLGEGPFFEIDGLRTLEEDPGTLDGRVRLAVLSVGSETARDARVADIWRDALERREAAAVEAEAALRALLDRASKAGELAIASAPLEIVP